MPAGCGEVRMSQQVCIYGQNKIWKLQAGSQAGDTETYSEYWLI